MNFYISLEIEVVSSFELKEGRKNKKIGKKSLHNVGGGAAATGIETERVITGAPRPCLFQSGMEKGSDASWNSEPPLLSRRGLQVSEF